MIRRIIHINEEKCNGCGACADACHESAIGMVNGKAKLLRDDYCDGLGDCLPACPTGAITFEEREAAAYDEAAVMANKQKKEASAINTAQSVPQSNEAKKAHTAHGCPGQRIAQFNRQNTADSASDNETTSTPAAITSQLSQWPVQIKLAPVTAPYLNGAKLLIAADCTAYAYANFHQDFIKGKITLVGCPKLDAVDDQNIGDCGYFIYRYYPETKEDDFIDDLAIGNLFVPTQYFIAQFERSDTRGEGDTGTK